MHLHWLDAIDSHAPRDSGSCREDLVFAIFNSYSAPGQESKLFDF